MSSCLGQEETDPPMLAEPSADTDSQGDFTDVWHASGPSGDSDDPSDCSWVISPSNAPFTAHLETDAYLVLADSTAKFSVSCSAATLSGTTNVSTQPAPGQVAEITGGSFSDCTDGRGDSWSAGPASGSSWGLDGDTITTGSPVTTSVITGDLTEVTASLAGSVGTGTAKCAFQLSGVAPDGDANYINDTNELRITAASLTVSQVSGSGCAAAGVNNNDAATLSGIFTTGNVTFMPGNG
jgi:hypothetical protein